MFDMNAINFMRSLYKKETFVDSDKFLRIEKKRISGTNGSITKSAPIDWNFTTFPVAVDFFKLIDALGKSIDPDYLEINQTSSQLIFKYKRLISRIDILADKPPPIEKTKGKIINLKDELLPVLFELKNFVGIDASRPWACGMYFDSKNKKISVTNNIVLVQKKKVRIFEDSLILPFNLINEIVDIGENPCSYIFDGNTITLNFSNGFWIKSSVVDNTWPKTKSLFDSIDYNTLPKKDKKVEFTLQEFESLVESAGFIFWGEEGYYTSNLKERGIHLKVHLKTSGGYNIHQLLAVLNLASHIDFSWFPDKPTPFKNKEKEIYGIIIGVTNAV